MKQPLKRELIVRSEIKGDTFCHIYLILDTRLNPRGLLQALSTKVSHMLIQVLQKKVGEYDQYRPINGTARKRHRTQTATAQGSCC